MSKVNLLAIAVIGFGSVILGCDGAGQAVEHPTGDQAWEMAHDVEVDDSDIVATVDGQVITRADVQQMWRDEPELGVDDVVDRLIERELLALEAKKRGYHERPEVSFARKQGMVAAMLNEEVEATAEPDEGRRADMLQSVEATRRAPEGLRASHLVVLVPREREDDDGEMKNLKRADREPFFEPARQYIDEAVERLDGQSDDDALRQVAATLNDEVLDDGFEAVVNEHMRFPRHGEQYSREHLPEGWAAVLDEFARGAESVADEEHRGELSAPVRTEFGWHIIRVDDLIEARPVEREAAQAFVDAELLREARRQKLQQLFESWVDDVDAQVYPQRLGSAFDE